MSKSCDISIFFRSRGRIFFTLLALSSVAVYSMFLLQSSYGLFSSKRSTKKAVSQYSLNSAKNFSLKCPCNMKYNDTSELPYVFESEILPLEQCCLPSIGNGYLATQVYGDTIHMNGLYNGYLGNSHRARIPSSVASIRYTPDKTLHVLKERFKLDVIQGTFFHITEADEATIEQRIYAHQNLSRILVNEITIQRSPDFSGNITLRLWANQGPESKDIQFHTGNSPFPGFRYMFGKTKQPETNSSGVVIVHVYTTVANSTITLLASDRSKTWSFITAVSNSSKDALVFLNSSLTLQTSGELNQNHQDLWRRKWDNGRMDVNNNVAIMKAIYGSLYYILSSLPPLQRRGEEDYDFYGLSPGGLAHGGKDRDYKGHVFWDQETWMYPTILMFHPALAYRMLRSRTLHLSAAVKLAKLRGHRGLEFPWEMAYSGFEVCPAQPYGTNELHINGDIALAVQQYLEITNDTDFLRNHGGWEMVYGLAKFWSSLATYNAAKKLYDINGVMPPDEYHQKINNSVYTNVIAQIALRLPVFAGKLIGNNDVPPEWKEIADKLVVVYDKDLKYHPEYEGYKVGTRVKQADAILLGFPLLFNMTPEVRRNDLKYYDTYNGTNVTDPDGPAMTWSMFTIGWLEVGDLEKMESVFEKTFANIQQPFKIWTELPTGSGATNFITGMGGFLQAILFGFGGFRIRRTSLDFNFQLPPKSTEFNVTGLDYQGNDIDFKATIESLTVNITRTSPRGAAQLSLKIADQVYQLKPGIPAKVPRKPGQLVPVQMRVDTSSSRKSQKMKPKKGTGRKG